MPAAGTGRGRRRLRPARQRQPLRVRAPLGAETIRVFPGLALDIAAFAMQRAAGALAAEAAPASSHSGRRIRTAAPRALRNVACAEIPLAAELQSGLHFGAIVVGSRQLGHLRRARRRAVRRRTSNIPVIRRRRQPPTPASGAAGPRRGRSRQLTLAPLGVRAELPPLAPRRGRLLMAAMYSLPNRRMVEAVQMLARQLPRRCRSIPPRARRWPG